MNVKVFPEFFLPCFFLAQNIFHLCFKRFMSTDSFSWSKMHFLAKKKIICIEKFAQLYSWELLKAFLTVLLLVKWQNKMSLWDTEIARINASRNVTHTAGAEKTSAVSYVPEEIITIINSLRAWKGIAWKEQIPPNSFASAIWSPGLADAVWYLPFYWRAGADFAEEAFLQEKRHWSFLQISYKPPGSHLTSSKVQAVASKKEEEKASVVWRNLSRNHNSNNQTY